MHGSFIFGIIFKSYNETERNFKNMQSDYVLGSRDTSRVAVQRKTGSLLWQIGKWLGCVVSLGRTCSIHGPVCTDFGILLNLKWQRVCWQNRPVKPRSGLDCLE